MERQKMKESMGFNFERVYQYDQDTAVKIQELEALGVTIHQGGSCFRDSDECQDVVASIRFVITPKYKIQIENARGTWKRLKVKNHTFNVMHFDEKVPNNHTLDFIINWLDTDIDNASGSGILSLDDTHYPILFCMGPKSMEDIDRIIKCRDEQSDNMGKDTSVSVFSNFSENILFNHSDGKSSMRVSLNRPNLKIGMDNYVALSIKPSNLYWGRPGSGYELLSTQVTKVQFSLQHVYGNTCEIRPFPEDKYRYGLHIPFSIHGFVGELSLPQPADYTAAVGREAAWRYSLNAPLSDITSKGGASAEGHIYAKQPGISYLKAKGDIAWVEYYWREFGPPRAFYFNVGRETGQLGVCCIK